MNNRHLEYKVNIPLCICTDKSKEQLIAYLKAEINHLNGIYTVVYEPEIEDITLCDCNCFECNDENYNKK